MSSTVKAWLRALLPPLLYGAAVSWWKRCRPWAFHQGRTADQADWQYVAPDWPRTCDEPAIPGWNVPSVARACANNWSLFRDRLRGTGPLAFVPEAPAAPANVVAHNLVMTFAYVLALAARNQNRISLLDWGGSLGHYYLLAQTLIPDLTLAYTCREVALLAQAGRQCLPAGRFVTDDTCLGEKYTLVMASGSLQFAPDWGKTLQRLADATDQYLYVTNLPTVTAAPSFVFVQRPYAYGYETEYLGWCLNRHEFLNQAQATGLELLREFLVGHRPPIAAAPEQNEYRGFLFRPLGNRACQK